MGKALVQQDNFEEAKGCFVIACSVLDKEEKAKPLEVAYAYIAIAEQYEIMNDFETEVCLLMRVLSLLDKLPGEQHLEGGLLSKIGSLLLLTGKVTQAIPYLERAAETLKERDGCKHFGVGYIYDKLGCAYLELEKPESAAEMFGVAKDILDVSLGPHHNETIHTCENLSIAYAVMKRHPMTTEKDSPMMIDVDETDDEYMGDDVENNIEEGVEGGTQVQRESRKRSKVWDHMTKIPSPNKEKVRARCNYCLQTFSARPGGGTSHMARHLEKCLARRNIDIRNFCIGSKVGPDGTQTMTLRDHVINPDEIRKAISMFIVAGAHPFSIVEEPGFKRMASYFCPSYKVMSRHTYRRDSLKMYEEEKKVVECDFVKAPGRIAFTTDNWRNDNTQDEYICITAHWIDSDWKLQKRIIRFGALTPPFDGINIADDVSSCLSKWNVADKVASFTLDNASYNNVMISEIKRQLLRSGKELLFDGNFFQIRCCCHIINLVVQAGLKVIDSVVTKLRGIATHFKHSIPKKKKFYEIAQQIYQLDGKKRLRGDCCVRWNSTYLMLDRALYFKRVIDHVIEKDNDLKKYILSAEEWAKVSNIHEFLKTFYNVTNEFSASKTPTSNLYFKGVWEMHCLLLDVANSPHKYLVDMVNSMENKFEKYWNEYNVLLSCACVLDPRYKLAFVEYCFTNLYDDADQAKEKAAEVKATLCNLLKEYDQFSQQNVNGDVNYVSVNHNFPLGRNGRLENFSSWMNQRTSVEVHKSELDMYLEEKNYDMNVELDILGYWKGASSKYPQLAALARDVLAIPISSVPSESAFSMGKKLINPWRASLTSLTIESLACYEDWLRAKDFSLRSSVFAPIQDDDDDDEDVEAK